MKFDNLVCFTQSGYFTVDYDVYRMSTCLLFSHFSFTTEKVLNTSIPKNVSACEIAKIKVSRYIYHEIF